MKTDLEEAMLKDEEVKTTRKMQFNKLKQLMKNKIWITRNGREIAIADLTDTHLLTIINRFYNNNFIGVNVLMAYLTGPEPSSDGAQIAHEQEYTAICDKIPTIWLDILEEEKERRGL